MDFDTNITNSRPSKHDFSNATDGASLWVATHAERVTAMSAFARWKEVEGSDLDATSSTVGKRDPRGAGYRIWFKKTKPVELRPVVRARLPYIENMFPHQIYILNTTGIYTNDDVAAAALSCAEVPTTIGEAKSTTAAIFAGETPFQIAHCLKEHGATLKEIKEGVREELDRWHNEAEERMSMYHVTDDMKNNEED